MWSQKIEKYLTSVLRIGAYSGGVFFLAIMLLTTANVIGRYGFNKPILGAIELSSSMMLVAIFLTIAYVMVMKGHITIEILKSRLSERTDAILCSVIYLVCLAFTVFMCRQTYLQIFYMMEVGKRTIALRIPDFSLYTFIFIGWALFSMAMLTRLVHLITGAMKK